MEVVVEVEIKRATVSLSSVMYFLHFRRKASSIAARKMYPERCISVSDSSGSTSIEAMHG